MVCIAVGILAPAAWAEADGVFFPPGTWADGTSTSADMARGGMRNRWVRPMFAAILVLLALAIGVPFLREVMGLVVPTLADLRGAAIVFVLTFLWLEGLRLALRVFARSAPSPLASESP